MALTKLLTRAGLKDDPAAKPMSIRNGAMRELRDLHGIEAAAHHMGIASLDVVGAELGLGRR